MPGQVYEIKDPQDGSIYELSLDHPPTPEEARTAVRKFRALGVAKSAPLSMRPPSPTAPVTLGDVMDNPSAAIQRMGTLIGHDLTDPKVLAGLLASYVVPKMVGAGPALGRMARSVDPADVVGMASPRMGNTVRVLQQARGAMRSHAPEVPAAEAPVPAHLDPTVSMRPSEMTSQQLSERIAQGQANPRPSFRNAAGRPAKAASRAAPATPESSAPATAPAASPTGPRPRRGKGSTLPSEAEVAQAPLTKAEEEAAQQWLAQGVPLETVFARIVKSRQLTQSLKTPTPDKAAADVANRNATGRWPE